MKIGIIGDLPTGFPEIAEYVDLESLLSEELKQCCIVFANKPNFNNNTLEDLLSIKPEKMTELWAIFVEHPCDISNAVCEHLGSNFIGIKDDIDFTSAFDLAMRFRNKNRESFVHFRNSNDLNDAVLQAFAT